MLWVADPPEGTTIVTDYTYNPDGALTAITTSVDGAESTTRYRAWDNFIPAEITAKHPLLTNNWHAHGQRVLRELSL